MYEFKVSRVNEHKVYVKNKNNNEYIVETAHLIPQLSEGDIVFGWVSNAVFYPSKVPNYEEIHGVGSSVIRKIKRENKLPESLLNKLMAEL